MINLYTVWCTITEVHSGFLHCCELCRAKALFWLRQMCSAAPYVSHEMQCNRAVRLLLSKPLNVGLSLCSWG